MKIAYRVSIPIIATTVLVNTLLVFFVRRSLESSVYKEAFARVQEIIFQNSSLLQAPEVTTDPFSVLSQTKFKLFDQKVRNSSVARLTFWSRGAVVWYSDLQQIIGQPGVRQPELRRVLANGVPQLVQKSKDLNAPIQTNVGNFLDMYYPVHVNGELIGVIEIQLVAHTVLQPIAQNINRIQLILWAVALLNVTVTILVLYQFVLRPIALLAGATRLIADDTLDQPITYHSADELGRLASSFETMRQRLRELFLHLEIKVQERTSELETEKTALATVQARDEAVLTNIGEGLVAVTTDGKIILVNQTFERLFGWRPGDVVGKSLVSRVKIVDAKEKPVPESGYPMMVAMKKRLTVTAIDLQYLRQDGKLFPAAVTASPIFLQGNMIGAVAIIRDITHEKEIVRMKDEFLSLASHELRTPMTVITDYIELIQEGEFGAPSKKMQEPLGYISDASLRLSRLANDLLDISRMEAGRMNYALSATNLSEVLTRVVAPLQAMAQKKNLKLVIDTKVEVIVQADPDKLAQIVHNLIGNSLKFTDRGSVTIVTKQTASAGIVEITDTGIGIPKEEQTLLFGKFQQLSSSAGRPAGTGLGLYLSRQLAQKMGGDLSILKSEPGQGTTFVLSLPMTGSDKAQQVLSEILEESKQVVSSLSSVKIQGK